MKRLVVCLLLLSARVFPCDVPGDGDELREILNGIQTLRAAFEQRLFSNEDQLIQQSSGQLFLARPDLLNWKNEVPYEEMVVADGEMLWYYEPALEQVSVRPAEANLTNTPAMLLIGNAENLERDYRIFTDADPATTTCFRLEPKTEGGLYDRVELNFNRGEPQSMSLWDGLGQKTLIAFNHLSLNGELPPELFVFTPPEGVDILRDD